MTGKSCLQLSTAWIWKIKTKQLTVSQNVGEI